MKAVNWAVATASGFIFACGSSTPSTFDPDLDSSVAGDSAVGTFDDSGSPIINPDGGPGVQPDASPPPPVTIVYAHGPDKLYRLDPITKKVTLVGTFVGCATQVIDLAIDATSNAFVTTFGGLYSLDLKTAKCTEIALGNYPNSLSFVPKGTLDPNQEALVGYAGSTYVRIDIKTGKVTTVGTLNGGYSSSGDVVSVINGGTFLTATGQSCADCLLQVDPKTGALVKNFGSIKHNAVYGLAFWAASLYGFDNAGNLFEITATGNGIQTTDIPIGTGFQWYGAGSSTSAPVANADGGVIPIN